MKASSESFFEVFGKKLQTLCDRRATHGRHFSFPVVS